MIVVVLLLRSVVLGTAALGGGCYGRAQVLRGLGEFLGSCVGLPYQGVVAVDLLAYLVLLGEYALLDLGYFLFELVKFELIGG